MKNENTNKFDSMAWNGYKRLSMEMGIRKNQSLEDVLSIQ